MKDDLRGCAEKLGGEVRSEGFGASLAARFVVIWTLITRIPLPQKFWPTVVPPGDRCLAIMPLAGGVLGLLTGLVVTLLHFIGLGANASAWLGAAFYALSGWVLHLDGWGDLWDGVGSGRHGEELRAVMKDSRLGSFGAVGLIIAFGLWTSLVSSLEEDDALTAIVVAGASGRFASCAAAFFGVYPWESGMAKGWVDGFTEYDLFTACACLLLFAPLAPVSWLFSVLLSSLVGFLAAKRMNTLLGGVNGDVLGACAVAGEICSLAVFALWASNRN